MTGTIPEIISSVISEEFRSSIEAAIQEPDLEKFCEIFRNAETKTEIFDILEELFYSGGFIRDYEKLFENLRNEPTKYKDILGLSVQHYFYKELPLLNDEGMLLFVDKKGEIIEIIIDLDSLDVALDTQFYETIKSILDNSKTQYKFLTGDKTGQVVLNSGKNKILIPKKPDNIDLERLTNVEAKRLTVVMAILMILGGISYANIDLIKNKLGINTNVSNILKSPSKTTGITYNEIGFGNR